jgi:hypothetical protein
MEHPSPSQVRRDRSTDNRSESGDGCENHVEHRQSDTSFMNEVKIANRSERDGFIRGNRNPLDNPSRKKLIIRLSRGLANNRPHNPEDGGNQKLRSFPINPCKRTNKWSTLTPQTSGKGTQGQRQPEPDTPTIAKPWQSAHPNPSQ